MNAQQTRQQHIVKVETEMKRLAAAVAALKADTADIPSDDWTWEGDWAALAQKMNEVTDMAESCSRISSAAKFSAVARELGRKGGSRTSPTKKASSAANGRKGGRPRRVTPAD